MNLETPSALLTTTRRKGPRAESAQEIKSVINSWHKFGFSKVRAISFLYYNSCNAWNKFLWCPLYGKSLFVFIHTICDRCVSMVCPRCGCMSLRNASHYTSPSRFYTNTPHSVIIVTPGATASEMKLWIFKLYLPRLFNNEELSGSWRTEFPFCETAKRRWRVKGGNGKQTLHIRHLPRSLLIWSKFVVRTGCMAEVVFAFWYVYGDPCDPWSV